MRVLAVTTASWKSGSLVRLQSGSGAFTVIGCDSVGSVICRPLGDDHLGIYVPPSLLVAAEPVAGSGAPHRSTQPAAENA